MRPKGSAKELEHRRRRAVALLKQGMRPAQVARAVGTSRASVTRWRQAYEQRGKPALAAKPHPGRPARLTNRQRQRLVALLTRGARRHGYATELWTLRRVAEVIAKHFGVTYHPGHVWYLLRGLGWTAQKPERRARERDEQAIARWREQDWPRLKIRQKKRAQHRADR
jgi:transposase